ncbi:MAG: hypothetical protein ABMA64_26255 [Myxococcota bacterium]
MWISLLLFAGPARAETPPAPPPPFAANRVWNVLPEPGDDLRPSFVKAGELLDRWTVEVAGVSLDGAKLQAIAKTAPNEPFQRVVREAMRLPIDPLDLLYFLDDVLVAGKAGRRGEKVVVPMGRARSNGILVHPADVFEDDEPKNYPEKGTIQIDEPPPQESFPEAKDGEPLGPNWTMRYRAPSGRAAMYATLAATRPDATFTSRIAGLVAQLEQQGADVYLTSFLRYRQRGYLMWGSFLLRRCTTASCVKTTVTKLNAANRSWAHVPIVWSAPGGWTGTREAARQMADAYDVVYATESGARYSNHYDGTAVDFVAVGLPRTLELFAPNGEHQVFDLSDPEQTRDLSLSPELITWIEQNFGLKKLESDHPHWDDAEVE